MTTTTVRTIIAGRVQGVSYRHWARSQALRLGLVGWVCNRSDGTVEAVFSGEPHQVETMLRACWQGPPAARVSDVQVEPLTDPDSLPASFHIRFG